MVQSGRLSENVWCATSLTLFALTTELDHGFFYEAKQPSRVYSCNAVDIDMQEVKSADWSENVAPFWGEVWLHHG